MKGIRGQVSVDTLDQYPHYSINTPLSPWLAFNQQSINTLFTHATARSASACSNVCVQHNQHNG